MIWSDLATWRGPTPNKTTGGMKEWRGLVVHIAEGYYEGTISWCKNPNADVSAHFILDRDGTLAQLVDTADSAWTQGKGNGHWLSVECAGFTLGHELHKPGWEKLTPEMVDAIARLLLKAHQQYGVPLQLAGNPEGRGLGYHSMGGTGCTRWEWGHCDCPGEPIQAQLPQIVERAKQLAAGGGGDEDDMGASTAPIDIPTQGVGSLCIPPVQRGDADPRPAWLNICNDTLDTPYTLRLWYGFGDEKWHPLAGEGIDSNGILHCKSGRRYSFALAAGTSVISVSRAAADEQHPAYDGNLTCCIERGAVIK